MKPMDINNLLFMAFLHFVAMLILMYVMVNSTNDIFINLNTVYMALIMTASMMVIEAYMKGAMYDAKKIIIISASAVLVFVMSFVFIRRQTAINDKEFLLSMIPHHSSAILMCSNAKIADLEIKILCNKIIESQSEEIRIMNRILSRL